MASTPFPSKPLTHLLGSNGPIHALTYSSSAGTYILTGSSDRNIRLYNPFPASATEKGAVGPSKLIQTYAAHGYEVLDIAVARYVLLCFHRMESLLEGGVLVFGGFFCCCFFSQKSAR